MGLTAAVIAAYKKRKGLAILSGFWAVAEIALLVLGFSKLFLLPGAYLLAMAIICKDRAKINTENQTTENSGQEICPEYVCCCGNCGNPLVPGAGYCIYCGERVSYGGHAETGLTGAAGYAARNNTVQSSVPSPAAAPVSERSPVSSAEKAASGETHPVQTVPAAKNSAVAVPGECMVEFRNVGKEYRSGETSVHALNGASFSVAKGQFAIILGASGAGKTTALNILGGMDRATSGNVFVDGKDITALGNSSLVKYRRNDIGFVFQFYNLVPNLTAKENVELAAQVCKDHLDPDRILEQVGLADRKGNFPSQLSGGEQQRVSIARALAKNPKMLLCDEPTGALDYVTGKQILQLLQDTCRRSGMTVVLITHNSALAPMADKIIRFKNGRVTEEKLNDHPVSISEIEW